MQHIPIRTHIYIYAKNIHRDLYQYNSIKFIFIYIYVFVFLAGGTKPFGHHCIPQWVAVLEDCELLAFLGRSFGNDHL